jgi:hypothetical protein
VESRRADSAKAATGATLREAATFGSLRVDEFCDVAQQLAGPHGLL